MRYQLLGNLIEIRTVRHPRDACRVMQPHRCSFKDNYFISCLSWISNIFGSSILQCQMWFLKHACNFSHHIMGGMADNLLNKMLCQFSSRLIKLERTKLFLKFVRGDDSFFCEGVPLHYFSSSTQIFELGSN